MTKSNIGFLIPITIINLGALVALYRAMIIAKDGGYAYHPSQPRPVIYDRHIGEGEQISDEWMHKVSVRPTTVCSLNLPHLRYLLAVYGIHNVGIYLRTFRRRIALGFETSRPSPIS